MSEKRFSKDFAVYASKADERKCFLSHRMKGKPHVLMMNILITFFNYVELKQPHVMSKHACFLMKIKRIICKPS